MPTPRLSDLPPPPPDKTGWPWTEESPPLRSTPPEGTPWPKVSIVTPSLNQGQFIEETIRSVLLQGYPDLEYLVVDGGSTDDTIDIVKKYGHWISHWESEPDRGQSHAINKGFARAKGEIVAWLNSDDFYLPGAVAAAARFLTAHPEAALVYGQVRVVDIKSKCLRIGPARKFTLEEAFFESPIPQPAAFMRASAVRAAGDLDESYHFSMDYDLWLRLAREGAVRSEAEPWAAFRWHLGSKTYRGRVSGLEDRIRVLESALQDATWHEYLSPITQGLGHSHWLASIATWAIGDEASSAGHVREGLMLYPRFIDSFFFPHRIASLLSNGPFDDLSLVTNDHLARVGTYFDLIPGSVGEKPRALRRARGYFHTVRALQAGQSSAHRMRHLWNAVTIAPLFVAGLAVRKLVRTWG